MTTEYYQIPSQQGILPIDSGDSADPWLAAATSSLSLADWSVAKSKQVHASLFEPEDLEASVSWNHVLPMQYTNKPEMKAPVVPKQFNSSTSKINAWSVVDNNDKQKKILKTPKAPQSIKELKAVPVVEEKPIEEELTAQNRYKTELCKAFTETGICRYGIKCQFAHGKEEIRPSLRHPKYKTEICKTFHTTGTCPYGIRCRFIHTRSKEESIATVIKQEEEEEDVDDDEVAAPPGLPVPEWSKSWTMSMSAATPSKSRPAAVAAPEPAF